MGSDGPDLAVLQETAIALWQAVYARLDQAVQLRGIKSLSCDILRDPRGGRLKGDGVGAAGLLQFQRGGYSDLRGAGESGASKGGGVGLQGLGGHGESPLLLELEGDEGRGGHVLQDVDRLPAGVRVHGLHDGRGGGVGSGGAGGRGEARGGRGSRGDGGGGARLGAGRGGVAHMVQLNVGESSAQAIRLRLSSHY